MSNSYFPYCLIFQTKSNWRYVNMYGLLHLRANLAENLFLRLDRGWALNRTLLPTTTWTFLLVWLYRNLLFSARRLMFFLANENILLVSSSCNGSYLCYSHSTGPTIWWPRNSSADVEPLELCLKEINANINSKIWTSHWVWSLPTKQHNIETMFLFTLSAQLAWGWYGLWMTF